MFGGRKALTLSPKGPLAVSGPGMSVICWTSVRAPVLSNLVAASVVSSAAPASASVAAGAMSVLVEFVGGLSGYRCPGSALLVIFFGFGVVVFLADVGRAL